MMIHAMYSISLTESNRTLLAILLAILEIIWEQKEEYMRENPTRTIADREMYKGKKAESSEI